MRFVSFGIQSSNLSNKEFNLGSSPFHIQFPFTLEGGFLFSPSACNKSAKHCYHKSYPPPLTVGSRLCLHSEKNATLFSCFREPATYISTLKHIPVPPNAPMELNRREQMSAVVIQCQRLSSSFKKKEIAVLLQPTCTASPPTKPHHWGLCLLV